MNFLVPTLRPSQVIVRGTNRQTDTIEIIYHTASWVVKNYINNNKK